MAQSSKKLPPLWRCPRCGVRLVTSNLFHSCGRFTLKKLFARSDRGVFRLFKKFEFLVCSHGRVIMIPQKTRVVFMVRVRFASAYPRKSYLLCGLGLPRKIRHRRLVRYQKYGKHFHGHLFRIESAADFDAKLRRLIGDSFLVGRQEYLNKRHKS